MSAERPHWAVYGLASAMGLVLLACMGLFIASEWSEAQKATWRWGFVDPDGDVAIPLEWGGARGFQNGRAAVMRDGLWGFIDPSGAVVVEPQFQQLCDYGGSELTCAQDPSTRDWGYVDDSGTWALPAKWPVARRMADGVGVIGEIVGRTSTRISNSTSNPIFHFGLVRRDGTVLVPVLPNGDDNAWTTTGPWSEGRMAVQVDEQFGYVDPTGAFVIEPRFRAAQSFQGDHAAVSITGGWAVIDATGAVVVPEGIGLAAGASEGRIAGSNGYYDLDGKPVGPRYEWVRPYSEGLGAVNQRKAWGFVDTDGELVIPLTFPRVSDFADGRAVAAAPDGLNYRWGIIDPTGSWVVEPTWRGVDESGFAEGLLVVGQPPEDL